ncbi:MAG TPA: hypothetical protein PKL31_11145 [Fulvivirga sp.]|nr:hypothetical protein [Fulvivirga sp.]
MKLEKILNNLNSLEKNSFIKIIDIIISNNPKNSKLIEKLISDTDKSGLKNLDNVVISKIFDLITDEYFKLIKTEFVNTSSQLDILIDIITRDGNCIMKQDWFSRLYDTELKTIKTKTKQLEKELENPKSELDDSKKRDYKIYESCLHTAYYNDLDNNREPKITDDELSILLRLSSVLGLSHEEVKLINYRILPVDKLEIDTVINDLKSLGIIFHAKKSNTIYVADEIVNVLRKIRGKEVADKYFRRVLRLLREPQINLICRRYNIDWKKSFDDKIKSIINNGVSFTNAITQDIHKDGTSLNDIKAYLNEFWTNNMKNEGILKGSTVEQKVMSLIEYFNQIEKDEKIGISVDGYDKLLKDLGEVLPKLNNQVKLEFEIQDENILMSSILLDYNIKPRDILDLITSTDIDKFCKSKNITTRGNDIENILHAYKDADNLYLENYVHVGYRDYKTLKENGIIIKEAEIGIKFEELTKQIFNQLGFNVDEALRKEISTKKDKIDILLNLGNNELILVECKSIKESGYNKFSAVSRQMKSYAELGRKNNYQIIKSLLIAPEFSDEFINETELEYELNLSLITASSLITILDGFKSSKKHKTFPYKLLMRDVLIDHDRILKAIGK